MKDTIRRCNKCGYETFRMNDDLKPKECKYCKGKLEIIMEERK